MTLVLVLAVLAGSVATPSSEPTVSPWSASSSVPRGGGSVDPGNGNHGGPSSAAPPSWLPTTRGTESGLATWCAPTPTHCQSWGGNAKLGAVPSFHYGDKPYRVRVCAGACVTVTVVSYCACGDRHGKPTVIDLSPSAFRRLSPLSVGVIDVTLRPVGTPALPQTDTAS